MTGTPAPRPTVGIGLILASSFAFAIGPVGAGLALQGGGGALAVATLRGVVAAALMALLIPLLRQGFGLDRRAWPWAVACGVLQGVAVGALIGAIALVPVGVAVLVFFTHPLLLAAVAHLRGTERLGLRQFLLIGAAMLGLALVLAPEFRGLAPAGVALAALSSVAIAAMILCIGRAQRHATSTQINLHATAIGTLGTGLLATLLSAWALPAGAAGWLGILAAGLGVGFGLLAFFAALRHLGPVRASVLSSLEPLISIVLASALLGQALRAEQWAGALLVVAALALFEAAGRRPAEG